MGKILNRFISLSFFLVLICIAITISFGNGYISAVSQGINLWATCVLPALFPYFFITAILSGLKATEYISKKLSPFTTKLFSVNGCVGYALLMSLLSGYPIGAKIVSDLKENGLIDQNESVRASALCSTSSPMFILGSVGNVMFNNRFFGTLLYLCHLLSIFVVGLIFKNYKKNSAPSKNLNYFSSRKLDNVLYESTYSAVISVLTVGGLITIFYLLSEILLRTGILSPLTSLFTLILGDNLLAEGLSIGLFECTRGLKILSCGAPSFLTLPVTASICGFGGLSVIAQSVAHLKKAKIKTAPFLLSKTLSAVLNFMIGIILSTIFF